MVDDLRGAEFGALTAAHERLTALARAADALRAGAGGLRTRLADTWAGRGADQAATRFDALATAAGTWHDGLVRLTTALDSARKVAADALHGWADQAGTLRGVQVDDLRTRLAQIDRLDALSRSYTADQLRTGAINLNGMTGEPWPSGEVITYLDDYSARYTAAVARFRRDLHAVHDATVRAWQAFTSVQRGVSTEPFAPVTTPSSATSPSHSDGARVTFRDPKHAVTVDTTGGGLGITVDDGDGRPTKYVVDPAKPAPATPSTGPNALTGAGTGADGASGAGAGSAGTGAGGAGGAGVGTGGGGGGETSSANPLAAGAATSAEAPVTMEPQPAASAQSGGPAAGGAPQGGTGGGMGGMGMGGMGGGGGQGGGDTERKASQWRLVGSLFEDEDPAAHFDGIVGEDPANRAKR
ncbi:hypothetical protein [Actinokineospora enzanensis]|uniref:hypothetical protein n=1 Tax=Actinokineospora enzanensis TaxID=155975 RepID=UPI0012EC2C6C|nr:hypothetical protein [Actinokineospora enzanensis]